MELIIDELGELKTTPVLNSASEAVYYALTRFVAVSPDAQPTMSAKLSLTSVNVAVRYFSKTETGKNIVIIRNAKKRNRRKARTVYRKRVNDASQ